MVIKRVLTIAGSDSGGGAGIQADLKALENIGVFGMSALTAVTAQNTMGVTAIHQLPPEFVAAQIDAVMTDIGADSVKVGMLGSQEVVALVADRLKAYQVARAVIDPVMVATTGALLLREDAVSAVREKLAPCAFVITPNLYEAEVMAGMKIKDENDLQRAARVIHDMGAAGVLIKGGHFRQETADDWFFDGRRHHCFSRERVNTKNTHGTGCTLSSAIAAYLCFEEDTLTAIARAKDYVHRKIRLAAAASLGKGHGPVCVPG